MARTTDPLHNYQWTPCGFLRKNEAKAKSLFIHFSGGNLVQKRFITPLIKCVGPNEAQEALAETHDGICGQHLGAKALTKKFLRAGCFWPIMLKDAKDYVTMCDKCQQHGNMHIALPIELNSLTSPWLFAWLGIDLIGLW